MKGVRILLTGANGFIGSHVLEVLVSRKRWKIGALVREGSDLSRISPIIESSSNAEICVMKKGNVDEIISEFKPDLVIHLAAFTVPPKANNRLS